MTRLEANRKILEIIRTKMEQFPDQRFGQLMRNIGLPLEGYTSFNIESEDLLDSIEEALSYIKKMPTVKKEPK